MNILDVIKDGDFLVLDCETTGLDGSAEICQIAIIDSSGNVLMDTLVKPTKPIPAAATAIHGITNEMVQDAPMWQYQSIFNLLANKNVVIYNADYDIRMLYQSTLAVTLTVFGWRNNSNWYCAMKHFAKLYGDWNSYHKSFRWQSLSVACDYYGIKNTGAHSALADCQATLQVCKAMIEEKVK